MIREKMEEKSEKWQESDKAQEWDGAASECENFCGEEMECPPSDIDTLDNLTTEI